ncbi:uncharacterized protein LOC125195478 [Salvia hispanica]|uniref:uncharacterized protein LOC125195478 n=1 Tax=Salvia hispanica TaxID=49212 RepID=UPI0020092415|nr:uncharacterized protein LOC125195478 [Salvia hispanica]
MSLWKGAIDRLLRQRQQAAVPRPIHRRHHVPRYHNLAHIRLYQDYFAPQPRFGDAIFRRRFRMHHPLFMHIVGALERRYEYFGQGGCAWQTRTHALTEVHCRNQAIGVRRPRPTCSTSTSTLGESSAIECLQNFCAGIRAIFEDCYLRSPSPKTGQRLINMHGSVHGFPGMLGSKDCMHLEWKNCSATWKGCTLPASKPSITR